MNVEISVIIAYIFGIILLYVLGKSLMFPMKLVVKLIYNAMLGGIILVIVNYFGAIINFHIALNIVTALVTGFLGIPGVLTLVILKSLFGI